MASHTSYPALIEALLKPSSYPHACKSVRLIETHISWVLLAGRYAYKIKKPVNLGFLDFSDLAKRRFYCQEEIRLNSRLAPKIYLDVLAIGGTPQQPALDHEPAFEFAVRMRRFPSTKLLSRLVKQQVVTAEHMDDLAALLAHFHSKLADADTNSDSVYGAPEEIATKARENFQQLSELLSPADIKMLKEIQAANEQTFSNCLPLFAQRKEAGFIRECHGDLHLGNIILINGQLVPFDGVEFDPKLRWIDVINDVAFLMMDLIHHDRNDLAFRFLNKYLEINGDYSGLGVMRFYLAYRAMVRAKITAIRTLQTASVSGMAECRRYILLAERNLQKTRPALLITHGLPGSGKTTLSQIVLENYSAVRLRSDVERKRLYGLAANESSAGAIYHPQATEQTYARLLILARSLLEQGLAVIVDAAFLKYADRQSFRNLAAEMNLPFAILFIETEACLLRERIETRRVSGKDASEADIAVSIKSQAICEPIKPDERALTVVFANNRATADLNAYAPGWDRLKDIINNATETNG